MSPRDVEAGGQERLHTVTFKQAAAKRKIVVCMAGMTACGKSTAARRLAQKFRLKYVSGGMVLKEMAVRMGYKAQERGWWESTEGLRFLAHRLRDSRFDKQVDMELLNWAERGNVVLDSWTMPWLAKTGFKVWLEVSPQERARRLARRDHISVREAELVIKEKDETTRRIYERLYGFRLGIDFSPFDLILDSELLSANDVFDTLSLVIDRLVLKKTG